MHELKSSFEIKVKVLELNTHGPRPTQAPPGITD